MSHFMDIFFISALFIYYIAGILGMQFLTPDVVKQGQLRRGTGILSKYVISNHWINIFFNFFRLLFSIIHVVHMKMYREKRNLDEDERVTKGISNGPITYPFSLSFFCAKEEFRKSVIKRNFHQEKLPVNNPLFIVQNACASRKHHATFMVSILREGEFQVRQDPFTIVHSLSFIHHPRRICAKSMP